MDDIQIMKTTNEIKIIPGYNQNQFFSGANTPAAAMAEINNIKLELPKPKKAKLP